MDTNEVSEAFEILLEEIEAVANDLNETGAEAFRAGDYERAKRAAEEASRLGEFREKVRLLQKEWKGLATGGRRPRQRSRRKLTTGRLARGLRTPEDAFRRPLLEALVELGGSAPMSRVRDVVHGKMSDVLNEYDHQPLPSDANCLRWRNTAQWCRNTLVREGLMKSDSPHGVWEITEEGTRQMTG